jgi:hypothetical protein
MPNFTVCVWGGGVFITNKITSWNKLLSGSPLPQQYFDFQCRVNGLKQDERQFAVRL